VIVNKVERPISINSIDTYKQILEEHKDVLPKDFTLRQFPHSSLQSDEPPVNEVTAPTRSLSKTSDPTELEIVENSKNGQKQDLLSVSSSSLSPSPVSQISPSVDTTSGQFSELSDSKCSPPKPAFDGTEQFQGKTDATAAEKDDDLVDFENISNKRFYHVFTRNELDCLIRIHCPDLVVYDSYYDHGNWCVCARKKK
jgi:hypothetical protein